jgi:hypothetical protein
MSTMNNGPDRAAAGTFLDAWVALTGAQHVTLVRIVPDTLDCKGRSFIWPTDRDAALRWIAASNVHANVYFSVNVARPVHKKPSRADIETLVAVHVDVDPRKSRDFGEERKRVLALAEELAEPPDPPTFILDSGGGIQAFYIAADPAAAEPEYVDEIEDLNHRLGAALGDDGATWNADRIMRVRGTVNHPDARKVANGQPPALARVLSSTGEVRSWLGDDLPPYATDEQLRDLFAKYPHLATVWNKTTCNPPIDDTQSGWDHRWASALAHEGVTEALIASCLRSFRHHHEPEKGKQDRADYILRTVTRATRDRGEPEQHMARISELSQAPEPPKPEPTPPDLNAPAFYGKLGEMIRTIDPLTEADPYGILAATLVMLGNWIGRRYYLRIGADRHYAAQQLIITGQSALSRKGTACNLAKAAMQVFDSDWHRDNIFYSLNSGQGIAQTVAQRNADASQTNANGDKRALFIAEEFADVLRKSQQRDNTILQVLRLAWDGSILENTSITHRIRVHGATVSLIGMITESELRQLLDPAQLATGSYNRMGFLVVNRSKELLGHPPEITDENFSAMRQIREKVDALPGRYQLAPDCVSAPIKLSAPALKISIEIKKRWETAGVNLVEQANSRAFMHVLRFALIYAVADGSNIIEPAHLEAAEHLVARMVDGVRRQATAELSDAIAQRILTHMREDPSEMLSRTGITHGVFSRNVPARDVENAIRTLMNLGLLQAQMVTTKGRPATMYALTPAATI